MADRDLLAPVVGDQLADYFAPQPVAPVSLADSITAAKTDNEATAMIATFATAAANIVHDVRWQKDPMTMMAALRLAATTLDAASDVCAERYAACVTGEGRRWGEASEYLDAAIELIGVAWAPALAIRGEFTGHGFTPTADSAQKSLFKNALDLVSPAVKLAQKALGEIEIVAPGNWLPE